MNYSKCIQGLMFKCLKRNSSWKLERILNLGSKPTIINTSNWYYFGTYQLCTVPFITIAIVVYFIGNFFLICGKFYYCEIWVKFKTVYPGMKTTNELDLISIPNKTFIEILSTRIHSIILIFSWKRNSSKIFICNFFEFCIYDMGQSINYVTP